MLDESPGILKPGKLPNCDVPSCKLYTAKGPFTLYQVQRSRVTSLANRVSQSHITIHKVRRGVFLSPLAAV